MLDESDGLDVIFLDSDGREFFSQLLKFVPVSIASIVKIKSGSEMCL